MRFSPLLVCVRARACVWACVRHYAAGGFRRQKCSRVPVPVPVPLSVPVSVCVCPRPRPCPCPSPFPCPCPCSCPCPCPCPCSCPCPCPCRVPAGLSLSLLSLSSLSSLSPLSLSPFSPLSSSVSVCPRPAGLHHGAVGPARVARRQGRGPMSRPGPDPLAPARPDRASIRVPTRGPGRASGGPAHYGAVGSPSRDSVPGPDGLGRRTGSSGPIRAGYPADRRADPSRTAAEAVGRCRRVGRVCSCVLYI